MDYLSAHGLNSNLLSFGTQNSKELHFVALL